MCHVTGFKNFKTFKIEFKSSTQHTQWTAIILIIIIFSNKIHLFNTSK